MFKLSVRHIHKRFSGHRVLNDVNLDIRSGEILVVLGPSGCGKSTLLNIIAGLEEADRGSIELNGKSIEHLAPKDRDVAMVFQHYALYPHMTVYDNIAFGLRMRKIPGQDIVLRVDEVAQMLAIEHLLKRKPRHLSGGERQRVAMGRAIARHPQIYLLDEPLSNLDAQLRSQIRTEIKKLHMRLGITMIFVTHDQIEAMTLADRIAIMNQGEIVQVGTPHELYHQPQTAFIGTFLGNPSMNIIQGRFDSQSKLIQLVNSPFAFKTDDFSIPEACLVGFRPEHVKLGGSNSLVLDGVVDIIEPTGSDLYASIECRGFTIKGRFQDQEVEIGQHVKLSIAREHIHIFDAESTVRATTLLGE